MSGNATNLFPLVEIRRLTKAYIRGKQVLEVSVDLVEVA